MTRRTAATPKTLYLSYHKTLVCYDGVQLFLGVGPRKRWYICVAIPYHEAGEHFLCTPVSQEKLIEYLYERVDLYALIKSSTNGKHYQIDLTQGREKGFILQEVQTVLPEWLPDRHVFASCHTEEFVLELPGQVANLNVLDRKIHIDGRWDAQDLSALPDLFTDNYSFLYALESNQHTRNAKTQEMFRKFPWRGGFSTVGFYQGLYSQIPQPHRLTIRGITYNSPGDITLSAVTSLVDKLRLTAKVFSENRKQLQGFYKQLYDGMSGRELLGRSLEEIDADANDIAFVEQATRDLAREMHFDMIDQLFSLAESNWIASAKILMSYFRRIKALADFFDSGKAAFR